MKTSGFEFWKILVFTLPVFLLIPSPAASVRVGGWISPISSLVCEPAPALDFSRDGEGVVIARCIIRNNSPFFQASFRFDAGSGLGEPENPRTLFSSVTWHGVGGLLGNGILPPAGEDILSRMDGNTFTWSPEEQRSATWDYVVEFRATWRARDPESDGTRIQITSELASAF